MNTLIDTLKSARHIDAFIVLTLQSGAEIKFPIKGNKRLEKASNQHLSNIEVSPLGLHWPDLDEDLSLKGILAGDHGQKIGLAHPV